MVRTNPHNRSSRPTFVLKHRKLFNSLSRYSTNTPTIHTSTSRTHHHHHHRLLRRDDYLESLYPSHRIWSYTWPKPHQPAQNSIPIQTTITTTTALTVLTRFTSAVKNHSLPTQTKTPNLDLFEAHLELEPQPQLFTNYKRQLGWQQLLAYIYSTVGTSKSATWRNRVLVEAIRQTYVRCGELFRCEAED